MKRTLVISIFAVLAVSTASAQTFDLGWNTIDGGGAMWTTGGSFELSGTIGQPDAGFVMSGGAFELTGGFWSGAAAPAICRGDCNCDGLIDFADIDPFVAVLSGGTPCSVDNCDVNGDGVIDFNDIDPFVALLSSGATCP